MRAAAPPYRGEGPHALWHVSEDPGLTRIAPHRAATALTDDPLVWAIDPRHLRPTGSRGSAGAARSGRGSGSARRRRAFVCGDRSARVHVIEAGWLERVATTTRSPRRLPMATVGRVATG